LAHRLVSGDAVCWLQDHDAIVEILVELYWS